MRIILVVLVANVRALDERVFTVLKNVGSQLIVPAADVLGFSIILVSNTDNVSVIYGDIVLKVVLAESVLPCVAFAVNIVRLLIPADICKVGDGAFFDNEFSVNTNAAAAYFKAVRANRPVLGGLVGIEENLAVFAEVHIVALAAENVGESIFIPAAVILDGLLDVLEVHNEPVAVVGMNVILKEFKAVFVDVPSALSSLVSAEGTRGDILKRLDGSFRNGHGEAVGKTEVGNLDIVLACSRPVVLLLTVVVVDLMRVDGILVFVIDKELAVLVAHKVIVQRSAVVLVCDGKAVALLEPAGIIAEVFVSVAVGLEFSRQVLVDRELPLGYETNILDGILYNVNIACIDSVAV